MAYTISRSSWHFRLYSYYLKDLRDVWREVEQVNLCPYMRALIFWLPLRFLIQRVVPAAVVSTIVFLNIRDFGIVNVLKFVAVSLGGGAAIVGLAYLGVKLAVWIKERRLETDVQPEPTSLVGQWMKANHEKICPCFEITR